MTASRADDDRNGTSTSRSLLAHAKRDDPAAWERLVRLYAPLVASWCRRSGVAEQDVADILQDVFSSVSGNLHRFHRDRPSDTFRGWLSTITRNKVTDHFRRRQKEPDVAGGSEFSRRLQQFPQVERFADAEEADAKSSSDEESMVWNDLLRTALNTIQREFHERTWRAFWGVVIEGRTAADVGADLDMKPGAVRVAKSRVLLRLRRELGDVAD